MEKLSEIVKRLYQNFGFKVSSELYTLPKGYFEGEEVFLKIVKSGKLDVYQKIDVIGIWKKPEDLLDLSTRIAKEKFIEKK
jgi:hypothetical protein